MFVHYHFSSLRCFRIFRIRPFSLRSENFRRDSDSARSVVGGNFKHAFSC